jgi:hypothetical protein
LTGFDPVLPFATGSFEATKKSANFPKNVYLWQSRNRSIYMPPAYRRVDQLQPSILPVPSGDVFFERFIHARLPASTRGPKESQYVVRDSDRRLGLLGCAGGAATAHELLATVEIRACDPGVSNFRRIVRITRAATRAF